MSATVHVTRPFRLADAIWPYQIVLDGQGAGDISIRGTVRLPTSSGTHTLQIRSLHVINRHLGLASPTSTLELHDGETAALVCHPRPFLQALVWWIKCLLGDRSQWIMIEQTTSKHPTSATYDHR